MTGRRVVVEADGGSRGNPGPAGYGAVVRDADSGAVLAERAAGIGRATNNVAEYRGLIEGLRAAVEAGAGAAEVRMDSKLVVEQMSGRWKVKHPDMAPLARQAAAFVRQLGSVHFQWVPREQNGYADRLANEAMDAAARGLVWSRAADATADAPPDAAIAPVARLAAPATDGPSRAGSPVRPATAAPNRLSGWMEATESPTTTMLVRHGETPLSVDKRFSGLGGQALTGRGRAQARAAAERLLGLGIDGVVSSPLRRAAETAQTVAAVLGLEVQVEEGLRETDFGQWEGSTFAEVRQRWPRELQAWLANPQVAPPGGESFAATTRRVRQARDRLLARWGGARLAVVSHVTPIKTLLRLALDAPPAALYRLHLELACLSEIDWYPDGAAVVRRLGDTCHLGAMIGGTADEPTGRPRQRETVAEERPGSTGQGGG